MFDKVEVVPAEPVVLAVVNGERAITDDCVERSSEAIDVEAVGSDHLPGEVAASAEAAAVGLEHMLLVLTDLMPDASSY
jgi:hypothetical protein